MSVFSKLKQFKDLRDQGKKMQDAVADLSITAKAGGDKVVLTLDGQMQISGLAIDEEMLSPDKKEKLQEAIKEAHKEALKKLQREMAVRMQKMGGFDLPGMK